MPALKNHPNISAILPTKICGQNAHFFAIFRGSAPGDFQISLSQDVDDFLVAEGFSRVFIFDQMGYDVFDTGVRDRRAVC